MIVPLYRLEKLQVHYGDRLALDTNLGIAAAQNRGIAWARARAARRCSARWRPTSPSRKFSIHRKR